MTRQVRDSVRPGGSFLLLSPAPNFLAISDRDSDYTNNQPSAAARSKARVPRAMQLC